MSYDLGKTAGRKGKPISANPYREGSDSIDWANGWFDGSRKRAEWYAAVREGRRRQAAYKRNKPLRDAIESYVYNQTGYLDLNGLDTKAPTLRDIYAAVKEHCTSKDMFKTVVARMVHHHDILKLGDAYFGPQPFRYWRKHPNITQIIGDAQPS